jgi:tetratricopeptide (TPR) repeat protein
MSRALLPLALVVATLFVLVATIRDARETAQAASPAPVAPLPGTSRADLTRTVEEMTARLATHPDDGGAVVRLSDALIRVQRVNNDGRAVITAEERLRAFLDRVPGHYEANRMLAAVLLSQHRFGDAIAQANRVRAMDPRDAWNYGAIGDGYLELGDYERAFAAFDQMGQLQPGPAAYARTAYGLEIKGDLPGALEYMRRAADGTSPNDPESQAWHFAQVGDLLLQQGRLGDARREYERAAATFPNHPLAMVGLARIKTAEGDLSGARLTLQEQLARVPTPDLAAAVGDLLQAAGDATGAEPYFRMAEQVERAAWGNGPEQPQVLARFLAEHDRDLAEAVRLAEAGAIRRRDIFTMDTLAWSYFKTGRLDEARAAMAQAVRTGSVDARILYHAAEIQAAAGETAEARDTLRRLPAPDTIADVRLSAAVRKLLARLSS